MKRYMLSNICFLFRSVNFPKFCGTGATVVYNIGYDKIRRFNHEFFTVVGIKDSTPFRMIIYKSISIPCYC